MPASSTRLGPLRILDRLAPTLERAHGVHIDPVAVFGADSARPSCSFDRLFYVESRSVENVEVRPIDPAEVAARMQFSLQYERRELMDAYLQFRFAFPSLRNELLEAAPEIEREALLRAFRTVPSYLLAHPYPVRIEQLWEKIRLLL